MSVEISLKEIHDNQLRLAAALQQLHYRIQQGKAEETPTEWEPAYINLDVPDGNAFQLYGHNGRRSGFTIQNLGPSDCLYNSKRFDVAQVLNSYLQGAGSTQVIRIGVVKSGSTVSLKSTSGLWVYNVNHGSGSPQCLLNIVETLYVAGSIDSHTDAGGQGWAGQQVKGFPKPSHLDEPEPLDHISFPGRTLI